MHVLLFSNWKRVSRGVCREEALEYHMLNLHFQSTVPDDQVVPLPVVQWPLCMSTGNDRWSGKVHWGLLNGLHNDFYCAFDKSCNWHRNQLKSYEPCAVRLQLITKTQLLTFCFNWSIETCEPCLTIQYNTLLVYMKQQAVIQQLEAISNRLS